MSRRIVPARRKEKDGRGMEGAAERRTQKSLHISKQEDNGTINNGHCKVLRPEFDECQSSRMEDKRA